MSARKRLAGSCACVVLAAGCGSGRAPHLTGAPTQARGDAPAVRAGRPDALFARSRANLRQFTSWLAAGHARGLIGEISWPGDPATGGDLRWNAVARDWYAQAAAAGLWVTGWAASELWRGHRLALFQTRGTTLETTPQGAVILAQHAYPELRGVTVAGGDFGNAPDEQHTSRFSNLTPGIYGHDYAYPSATSWRVLAAKGVRLVRLPLRWERIQRVPRQALDASELARLRRSVRAAAAVGLKVILDLHNYGAYYLAEGTQGVRRAIGSPQLPVQAFADVWRRLALAFGGDSVIAGYGLMNEPVGMGGSAIWERASRAAVAAIRTAGDRHRIFVQSYYWGGATNFREYHPRGPWISDPNLWYEGHQYFDDDNSARYVASYDSELAKAKAEGFSASPGRR